MACTIKVTLVSERVDGDIGDDWQYSLAAEVFNPGSLGHGRLDVARHKLAPGDVQVPPNQQTLKLPGGESGTTARVELTLAAAEVDWIFSDTGEKQAKVELRCPEAGEAPVILEREVAVHVEEKPRLVGGSANLIVKVRVAASAD